MEGMTTEILRMVKATMTEQGISQKWLAEQIGISENQASRILQGKSTTLPDVWAQFFDLLGLRLIVVPKDAKVSVTREL